MTDLNNLSVKELVRYHNQHPRVKAINVWKESKAKLLERVIKAELAADPNTVADKPTKPTKVVEAAKVTVKGEKKSSDKVRKSRELGVVGDFAKTHDLNPKVLRAALRRAGHNAPYTVAQLEKLIK